MVVLKSSFTEQVPGNMKQTSATRISIRKATFFAYHGVRVEEQTLGGKYEVDIDIYYNSTQAAVNDDVKDALNYEEVMYHINEVMSSEPYSLLETIALEILDSLMDKFPILQKATVRVRKLSVPMRHVIDHVEVEQTMTRAASQA
jgi:dihydroneopterin aldolase